MRAIRIHAYGGPEVMQLEEVPMPIPRPGQARIRVHAASVNFLDVQKRRANWSGKRSITAPAQANLIFPQLSAVRALGSSKRWGLKSAMWRWETA
jgi:NADPH:quinone reductase-like Zn-dependent oxidoreductase